MTHIQTKHQYLLGFVLNPTSISLHLTMNPTTREDSILILFLVGLTNLNFKKSKFRIQFYQNPRFRDKILTIQSLKISCDPYKIHTESSFHTFLLDLLFLFFSSSFSSSSSLLLLPSVFDLSPKLETNLAFKSHVLLRPCLALQNLFLG